MSRLAKVSLAALLIAAPLVGWFASRPRHVEAAPSEIDGAWTRLVAFDAERRAKTDFAKQPTWDRVAGPDPYIVRAVPGSSRLVGILRGGDALVTLDASLAEVGRVAAPRGPVGLAVGDDGSVLVSGERSGTIARYGWKDQTLVSTGLWDLDGVSGLRDVAFGPRGWIYAVDEHDGNLLAFRIETVRGKEQRGPVTKLPIGNGPIHLERVGDALVVNCLLDHQLVFVKLTPSGAPSTAPPVRVTHDGPFWSFAARALGDPDHLLVAAGGVEDHPLDRTIGAFGYIDSFLYVYRIDMSRSEAVREAAINLSELGVVTPKAMLLETSPAVAVTATGYASDKMVRLDFDGDRSRPPRVKTWPLVPGTNAVTSLSDGTLVFADPLLDAWVRSRPDRTFDVSPVRSEIPRADVPERIGEALVFTTLMAPWNQSDGAKSRFTCETCHFEGYVDGRTHHTGRGDVHAVTKPLLGLWNNRPHFSRALDEDLSSVAFNEFRVAGAKSDHDPWFKLLAGDAPWLTWLGWEGGDLSPELLRRAFMSFLMAFTHRPNPDVLGRSRFTEIEQTGATLFRDRCESCHEARLVSDVPSSRVPFERWQSLVMSPEGAIVWGKAQYEKTGIEPYVHENGARVPSLRRLYKKRPYFTNGSAKDLASVLAMVRTTPEGFSHAPPKPDRGATLDESSCASLLAFLDLL